MNSQNFLTICNDGPDIGATNFWQTPSAQQGSLYVSFNAGAARLLVPPAMESALPNLIKGVKHVLLTFGFWRQMGVKGFEWLAEDGSRSPYALHLAVVQVDRVQPVPRGEHHPIRASIWVERNGQPTKVADFPAFLRSAPEIPCLKALPHNAKLTDGTQADLSAMAPAAAAAMSSRTPEPGFSAPVATIELLVREGKGHVTLRSSPPADLMRAELVPAGARPTCFELIVMVNGGVMITIQNGNKEGCLAVVLDPACITGDDLGDPKTRLDHLVVWSQAGSNRTMVCQHPATVRRDESIHGPSATKGAVSRHYAFSRREVGACDFSAFLARFGQDQLLSEPAFANLIGSLDLSIKGYDTDPRELPEIAEVRHFLKALAAVWPFATFLGGLGNRVLLVLTLARLGEVKIERLAPGSVNFRHRPQELTALLVRDLKVVRELWPRTGLPISAWNDRIDALAAYFQLPHLRSLVGEPLGSRSE